MNERLKLREKIRVWSENCVLEWDGLMPIYRRGRESSKPWIITITWSSTSLGRNCALQLHSPFFRDQNGQLKRAPELLFWVGELVFARSWISISRELHGWLQRSVLHDFLRAKWAVGIWHLCSFSSRELFFVARGLLRATSHPSRDLLILRATYASRLQLNVPRLARAKCFVSIWHLVRASL